MKLQLKGNVKARFLDEDLTNKYVKNNKKPFRSQIETYKFLEKKKGRSMLMYEVEKMSCMNDTFVEKFIKYFKKSSVGTTENENKLFSFSY